MTEYQQRRLFELTSLGWRIADQWTHNHSAFYALSNGQNAQLIVGADETINYKWS